MTDFPTAEYHKLGLVNLFPKKQKIYTNYIHLHGLYTSFHRNTFNRSPGMLHYALQETLKPMKFEYSSTINPTKSPEVSGSDVFRGADLVKMQSTDRLNYLQTTYPGLKPGLVKGAGFSNKPLEKGKASMMGISGPIKLPSSPRLTFDTQEDSDLDWDGYEDYNTTSRTVILSSRKLMNQSYIPPKGKNISTQTAFKHFGGVESGTQTEKPRVSERKNLPSKAFSPSWQSRKIFAGPHRRYMDATESTISKQTPTKPYSPYVKRSVPASH